MAAYDQKKLEALVTEGHYAEVAPQLDIDELQSTDADVLGQDWPVSLHMLGHIYNNDLENARFLWKRLPDVRRQQDAEAAAVFSVLQAFWNKDYQALWPALAAYHWSALPQRMVEALGVQARGRALALLSRAYATISAHKAAAYLGLPEDQSAQIVQQEGWVLDPATSTYKVTRRPVADTERAEVAHLERLAEYMVHLESS